jgi:O-antigen biosynthesis protein
VSALRLTPLLDRVLRGLDRLTWAVRKRGVFGAIRRLRRAPPFGEDAAYARWQALVEARAGACRAASDLPTVAVLLPAANAGAAELVWTLVSLRGQRHARWTALIPLGGAPEDVVAAAEACAAGEPRVRLLPGSEPDAGIDCGSPVLVLASPGIILAPQALEAIAGAWTSRPAPEMLYGDEDRLDGIGRRVAPVFKPGFSPDLLRAIAYFGRLLAFTPDLARRAGGLGKATVHDVALRLAERATQIVHVPEVLHHVPPALGADPPTEATAVRAALARGGEAADVLELGGGRLRVRYTFRGEPLVSVIVPTRDRAELLRTALDAVRRYGGWPRFELLVVDNGSIEPETARLFGSLSPPDQVFARPGRFDFAALNNDAALEARGEILLFLNNDIEALEPGWMAALVEHAQRPEVGVVGAKLLYPNRTVQHAGIALGMGGFAGHPYWGAAEDDPGPSGILAVARGCSAVTGACLMIRRELFISLGGFDAELRQAFNDVDLCLRAAARGLRTVVTPHARLIHHESATRSPVHPRSELHLVRTRWGRLALAGDPHVSPHVELDDGGARIRAW